ncbi:SRPBCC domain-containing protein [Microbispora sp. RL4-1S]|uniref:SRPBCC domain-containing protein n=2 Tax=Microbispora oryzae TaxID=2806554 RepID=A0A941AL94_9ACTN|nr:SRPBCC domain-containing protein [Microbispora oryzae]
MLHEFELHKEIELTATPEQVWEAIATGPGTDAWFMGRNQIEQGEGGRNEMDLLGRVQRSTVTGWEPGKRFSIRGDANPDGSFLAMEYLIEGRDGGSTVLRLVQSGFLGDDWETEYEAMQEGWDMYLHKLSQYLTYFPGRGAVPISAVRPRAGDRDRAWATIMAALGLDGPAAEGDPVRFQVDGLPPAEGVVDYAGLPTFLGVRTSDALYRFIHSGPQRGDVVVLGHHVFADVDREETERAWRAWLDHLFA